MKFEQRVLAAKAKLDEAADELLELLAESPSVAGDIMQVLNPTATTIVPIESREFLKSQLFQDGIETACDEIELSPYSYMFERRKIDHDKGRDVVSVKGGVMLILALYPQDEAER